MTALTKNAISVMVRYRAKQTNIWDHKGYKSQITNIFRNSKFYKKKSKWPPNSILVTVTDREKLTKIWDHNG